MGNQEHGATAATVSREYGAQVAANIAAAIAKAGANPHSIAAGTGIARSTLQNRLKGLHPFTVTEVAAIAHHLRIDTSALYPRDGVAA